MLYKTILEVTVTHVVKDGEDATLNGQSLTDTIEFRDENGDEVTDVADSVVDWKSTTPK